MNGQSDTQLYIKAENKVKEIIKFNEETEAIDSIKAIKNYLNKKGYKNKNPDLFNKYNRLIAMLRWVASPLLKEAEVLQLFSDNFGTNFEMGYFDLRDKFKSVLINITMHEDRDKLKKKVRDILNRNQTRITPLKLENGGSPTVENWIKDYSAEVGIESVDNVKFQNYFVNNKNIKKLKPEEKRILKEFFQFYEKLKLSSLTIAGIEETVQVNSPELKGVIREGGLERDVKLPKRVQRIFDIVSRGEEFLKGERQEKEAVEKEKQDYMAGKRREEEENQKLAELELSLGKYPLRSLERKIIEEEIEQLKTKTKK